jgi:hypothetical protein
MSSCDFGLDLQVARATGWRSPRPPVHEKPDHDRVKKWSERELFDLRHAIKTGYKVPEIATFLMRTETEVRKKAVELGLKLPPVR